MALAPRITLGDWNHVNFLKFETSSFGELGQSIKVCVSFSYPGRQDNSFDKPDRARQSHSEEENVHGH